VVQAMPHLFGVLIHGHQGLILEYRYTQSCLFYDSSTQVSKFIENGFE